MNLWGINQAIENCIDPETGEISDFEAFESLQVEREVKIDSALSAYKNLVATEKALKDAEASFASRRTAAKNNAERLKSWIAQNLDGEKFENINHAISWRKSETTNILDAKLIPDAYKTIEVVEATKIDKNAIKQAIKNGDSVPGAEVISNNNIQIK